MKNVDKSAEDYLEYLYGEDKDEEMYRPDTLQSKLDFKYGYNAAIKNLKQIVQQLQKEEINRQIKKDE
jgi:hypothetical protein